MKPLSVTYRLLNSYWKFHKRMYNIKRYNNNITNFIVKMCLPL